MSNTPKYTVAVCNYNMADTLEESLRSILDQLDERFEVLVIDDGSTDGSQEILDKLEEEYEILRWIEGQNNNLAEARNQSFKEAKGEHILESLDSDDKYKEVIQDFVKIYEELRKKVDEDFYLNSNGLNIAPRELLIRTPYRSLGYGEDDDFRRRLLHEEKLINLEINKPYEELGYQYGKVDRLKLAYRVTTVNFRSGITLQSFLSHKLKNIEFFDDIFKIIIAPLALIHSLKQGRYEAFGKYYKMGEMEKDLDKMTFTLSEIEEKYELTITENLSKEGEKILYVQT